MTFRGITVYENGQIREQEWNAKSSFTRQRILFEDGQWVQSYIDEDGLDYGYTVVYFENGNIYRGETFKGKWHGHLEKIYTDGRMGIGSCFNGIPFGDWRVIEKDKTEKILKDVIN